MSMIHDRKAREARGGEATDTNNLNKLLFQSDEFEANKGPIVLDTTLEEMKQEFKESEGDPHVKGKRRQLQREMSRGRMLAAVAEANVVVTNPTHYAVALRYEDGALGAPKVVAKGADLIAARIRELAAEANVPMLEAPPLARALYTHVEIDQEIPAALYAAVAQVLAWVYQLEQFASGRGVRPKEPAIAVPVGMDPLEAKQ